MNAHTNVANAAGPDRRDFIKGAAGLTFAFALGGGLLARGTQAVAADASKLNAWITIGTDNTVTLLCPSAEMGQGVWTSLPLVLAEELDADWSKVKVENAPPIPPIYGNPHPVFHGAQVTAYSTSVSGYFNSLRIAGAQARRVLIDNAAAQWKVARRELTAANGVVTHAKSGRKISYGDIAKIATVPAEPPKITAADLKKPSQFKLIGHTDVRRLDLPAKVNGSAQYGIDVVDVPGAVYACVLQAPAEGAKAAVSNLNDVAKMKDIAAVIPLPFGVAVIGGSVEATRAGRKAFKVTWDRPRARQRATTPPKPWRTTPAPRRTQRRRRAWPIRLASREEINSGAKVVEANYSSEYVYHAQMEPMNASRWWPKTADRLKSGPVPSSQPLSRS